LFQNLHCLNAEPHLEFANGASSVSRNAAVIFMAHLRFARVLQRPAPILESCPEMFEAHEVSGRGELRVLVDEDTSFDFRSKSNEFPIESELVEVFWPGEGLGPIGGEAVCEDGVLRAFVNLESWQWDRNIIVGRVFLREFRPQVISHGAHSYYLKDTISTEAFRGEELVGRWMIASPLQEGESCSDPKLPKELAIDITVTCRPPP
jgi:hypothetical protein